jgi:enoyl-CoA hydratase/carnithine racemase
MSEDLIVERKDAVCTLIVHRPEKHNVLTPSCLDRLTRVLADLEKEDAVRAVVIRGAGARAFSAGYDIASLPVRPSSPPLERAFRSISGFPYPVLAMINGIALGGGCELAVACDMRIMGRGGQMGMPPARLGLVYPYEGLRRFLRVLGFSRTLELFLTARRYDSAACLRMGLVNEVVDDEDLEAHTFRLAAEVAAHAPLSLRGMKSALHRMADQDPLPPEAAEEIQSLFLRSLQSGDAAEAKRAFLEKRPPRFQGR